MKNIALIGSTGSIGTQTLEVIRSHPDNFNLVSLGGGKNTDLILKQIEEFRPALVSVAGKKEADYICQNVDAPIKVYYGREGLNEVATHSDADMLINAVVGSLGLQPTLHAIEAGLDIGIANKETLVTAGHLVTKKAREYGVHLLPVDSEHSAIFQCLEGNHQNEINRLILTASGGSFRDKTREELQNVNVEEALQHPNWNMGAKITIDSATMMNKGLEVIEAHWLFNIPYEQIEVVIHKESIVHSLVEYCDKSVLAQLGTPDMKVPIQYAMTYPQRLELEDTNRLNLWETGTLHFKKPDFERYRCLTFAYEAGKTGGTLTTVLNAANEEAVDGFLQGKIPFLAIEDYIEKALDHHQAQMNPDLETILEVDKDTRAFIRSQLG
ncbi:1-deoxy-D-xylulose-5-phosphate reductoisomerase [Alteribacillus iranensis]|uniref:1-deoxy-D-xylulose 5-phosphate reductoisomerase n=1 Tax=Alteribacillus iranensis TaxID=930128 RepID=A0A1I2A6K6_9BACI|nr:1-deoxy-D-xylulose-5-phosphate reductoisomerase [Alteribacillus iranensis]SFE38410.1 1-deoxy-D-xylulose 5-phosphate reductoisomerase [Alteribacillus iranensis]